MAKKRGKVLGFSEEIDEVVVFLVSDPSGEGLAAVKFDNQWVPLIACDEERRSQMRSVAQELADEFNKVLREVRFSKRELIKEIRSRNQH
ncbi:MAG: hypothetical protein QW303_03355 [Nitrososphaerota archaeon]